jgi:hypothetical protein
MDERQPGSQARLGDVDGAADERERHANEREDRTDAREAVHADRYEDAPSILAGAAERDNGADTPVWAADKRNMAANLRSFLHDDDFGHKARRSAAVDRAEATTNETPPPRTDPSSPRTTAPTSRARTDDARRMSDRATTRRRRSRRRRVTASHGGVDPPLAATVATTAATSSTAHHGHRYRVEAGGVSAGAVGATLCLVGPDPARVPTRPVEVYR